MKKLEEMIEAQEKKCREEEETKVVTRYLEGIYAGQGIRKTRAYDTNLSRQEFAAKRSEFWGMI